MKKQVKKLFLKEIYQKFIKTKILKQKQQDILINFLTKIYVIKNKIKFQINIIVSTRIILKMVRKNVLGILSIQNVEF